MANPAKRMTFHEFIPAWVGYRVNEFDGGHNCKCNKGSGFKVQGLGIQLGEHEEHIERPCSPIISLHVDKIANQLTLAGALAAFEKKNRMI